MDMILGVFTTVFVGVPLTIICLAISWWMNERIDDNDDDTRIYVPSWCRNRRSNNGHDKENKG